MHQDQESPPWWRVGMVWLVISGPLAAVIGGVFAAVVAVRGADQVVSTPATMTPAVQARNHAATPQR